MLALKPTPFNGIKEIYAGPSRVGFLTKYLELPGYLAYNANGIRVEGATEEATMNAYAGKLLWSEIKANVLAASAKAMAENSAFVAGRLALYAEMKKAA